MFLNSEEKKRFEYFPLRMIWGVIQIIIKKIIIIEAKSVVFMKYWCSSLLKPAYKIKKLLILQPGQPLRQYLWCAHMSALNT